VARATVLVVLAAAATAMSGCTNSGSEQSADLVNGKQLFVEKCGACHILNRAGTKGITGPNLDSAFQVARDEGWGNDSIRGAVYGQIQNAGNKMPADIVTGQDAQDVAAYVAAVAAQPGKDGGFLANAVKAPGAGKTATAEGGKLAIAADPGGQLVYVETKAEAPAGALEVEFTNESSTPHDWVLEGTPLKTKVITASKDTTSGTLKAGKYTYFCSVPGHREAGMEGELTVE
jgi:plastocyanin